MGILRDFLASRPLLRKRPLLAQLFGLEVTENYIHIPIQKKTKFCKKSFRTVTLSEAKGIKAVMGKYLSACKPKDRMHIQKYLFDRSKGWTKSKAKAWVKKHKPKKKKKESRRWGSFKG